MSRSVHGNQSMTTTGECVKTADGSATHLISRYAAGSHFVDVWCCCLCWRSIQMVCYSFSRILIVLLFVYLATHTHTLASTQFPQLHWMNLIFTSVRETTKNHTFLFPFRFSLGTAGLSRHTTFSLLPWERRSTTRNPEKRIQILLDDFLINYAFGVWVRGMFGIDEKLWCW